MSYLLDNSVILEAVKKTPDEGLMSWLKEQDESNLYLSVLTVGELHQAAVTSGSSKRARIIRGWLDRDLVNRFSGRILPIDIEVCRVWGEMCGAANPVLVERKRAEMLLVATAKVHSLTLVARNSSGLGRYGQEVLDPWTG